MTVLTKQDGVYVVKPGDNLSRIAASQGRTLADLLAMNPQFQSNPNLIRPGQTVNYSSLTNSNIPTSTGITPPPALANTSTPANPTTNFTTALIQMLKDAQQRNTTGQANLMKQDQNITGLGLNDAARNFNNPLLTPNAGTSLGMSAQNEFDPMQLSIANQQKLATQNLGNITDLVNQTTKAYQDEQDRAERAKSELADAEYKKQVLAETIRAHKADESTGGNTKFTAAATIPEFTKQFESETGRAKGENTDNYVSPQTWMAARTLWGIRGGSDSSFVSNFKKYLNPLSYGLVGFKEPTGDVSPEMQALLDGLQ